MKMKKMSASRHEGGFRRRPRADAYRSEIESEGILESPAKSNPRARYDGKDSAYEAVQKAVKFRSDPLAHGMMHEDRRPSQNVKGQMVKDHSLIMMGEHGGEMGEGGRRSEY